MGKMKEMMEEFADIDLRKKNYVWCQLVALAAGRKIPTDAKKASNSLNELAWSDPYVALSAVQYRDAELSASFTQHTFEFHPKARRAGIRLFLDGNLVWLPIRSTLSRLDVQEAVVELKHLMCTGKISKESALNRIVEMTQESALSRELRG